MPRFPSTEWAEEYARRLNENAAYAKAAAAWEGDILLLITPDEAARAGEGIHLDLAHGRCRAARYVPDPATERAEFVYRGTRESWSRLLRRELDPVKAVLDGTFKLQGNMLKAMRFTAAAKEMLDTAAAVPLG